MTTSYHIALFTALLAAALAGCNSSSGGGGTADADDQDNTDHSGDQGGGGGLVASVNANAVAQADWEWRYPLPQGNTLHAIKSLNGEFFAVGNYGTLMRSTDGDDWTVEQPGTMDLFDIAYNGTTYVAVGGEQLTNNEGNMLVSDNGVDWDVVSYSSSLGELRSVIWTGNEFLAMANNYFNYGTVIRSTNGRTWSSAHVSTSQVTGMVYSLATNDTNYIAAGNSNLYRATTNLTSWLPQETATPGTFYYGAMFDSTENQYVAVGDALAGGFLTSDDGDTWTTLPEDTTYAENGSDREFNFLDIIRVNTDYWLTDLDGNIHKREVTPDPDPQWNQAMSGDEKPLYGIAELSGALVAVGENGKLFISNDSATWSDGQTGPATGGYLQAVAKNDNGRFVVVGEEDAILYSDDGVTWEAATTPVTDARLNNVTWTGTQFVAVGTSTNIYSSGGVIASSPDGDVWEQAMYTVDTNQGFVVPEFSAVAGADNGWVAMSQQKAYTCTDVNNCEPIDDVIGTTALIHTGDRYLMAADFGKIFASDDGTTWSEIASPADRELTLMADTGSLIIAASKVNPREYLYLSADRGDTWTQVDFSDEDQFQWSHLTGSNGVFYGQDGNRRILWTSTDGTTWQREISPHIVVDVANDNGAQLIVGDVNHIVRREAN